MRFLTPTQQGYYSTFGSFMGLQIFFELGLSLVLMQFASHERAGLEWTPQRTLAGDPVAKARLASLLRRGLVWYGVMALLVLLVVFPAGMVFFHHYAQAGTPVAWQGPWLFLSVGVADGPAVHAAVGHFGGLRPGGRGGRGRSSWAPSSTACCSG